MHLSIHRSVQLFILSLSIIQSSQHTPLYSSNISFILPPTHPSACVCLGSSLSNLTLNQSLSATAKKQMIRSSSQDGCETKPQDTHEAAVGSFNKTESSSSTLPLNTESMMDACLSELQLLYILILGFQSFPFYETFLCSTVPTNGLQIRSN